VRISWYPGHRRVEHAFAGDGAAAPKARPRKIEPSSRASTAGLNVGIKAERKVFASVFATKNRSKNLDSLAEGGKPLRWARYSCVGKGQRTTPADKPSRVN